MVASTPPNGLQAPIPPQNLTDAQQDFINQVFPMPLLAQLFRFQQQQSQQNQHQLQQKIVNPQLATPLQSKSAFPFNSISSVGSLNNMFLTPENTDSSGYQSDSPANFTSTPLSTQTVGGKVRNRPRPRGQTMKTALVWEYFEQRPGEQAATCKTPTCNKIIKATNSSTTGMIRHNEPLRQELTKIMAMHQPIALHPTEDANLSVNQSISPSAVSPNSITSIDQTASSSSSIADSSLREQRKSTSSHFINSLLIHSDVAANQSTVLPPQTLLSSPQKYMADITSKLLAVEENAKKSAAIHQLDVYLDVDGHKVPLSFEFESRLLTDCSTPVSIKSIALDGNEIFSTTTEL
ncbi:Zinc finger BED domain-containing protein 4 [Aphelenchoides besseyi]|nr:Zinc finger BED domain-containing protein 4 [Aphelenchoides besseyi]KAI6200547.1 Zinc finger BED domain-containing protein 4 [Aphelenchoides besseyi]